MTTLLAILVAVAIVGQLALILWARSRHTFDNSQVAKARARLLEDAADRQAVTYNTNTAKLDAQEKGVGGE